MNAYNLVSFGGIILLLGLAWLLSSARRQINWKVVGWGTGLQILFALFIFIIPAGMEVFKWINSAIVTILDSATAGTRFLFGRLALPPGTTGENGETSLGFFLAFQGLPTIVFFASLMGILYYLKIMPMLIRAFAYVFTKLMRISGAESLCVSSNIFVGVESALTIRPHLNRMTRSELHTILTGGMATIASSVLVIYVLFLRDTFPAIAGHLVSATILSAPAALVMSKMLLPELEEPETLGIHIQPEYTKDSNIIEAAINGAHAGVKLVVGVAALLLAFLGLLALLDLLLGGIGSGINKLLGLNLVWSLKNLLGTIFYPFTLIIGIPPADAMEIARIIGERTVITEIASYQDDHRNRIVSGSGFID